LKHKTLILDAMGVMYPVGDDVKYLLCPFIAEKGGITDIEKISSLYNDASLGKMTSTEFWQAVGIDPILEDEYLQRHKLTDGLIEFLEAMNSSDIEVWCLSNDLAEWAKKLRDRFKLARYIRGFVISGDVGLRKPDPAIFHHLLHQTGVSANEAVFVDDNPRNLASAAKMGFRTILFSAQGNLDQHENKSVKSFKELLQYL
jgi:HAD superfamily hydrolase (TIGR01509 family)